MKTSDSIKDIAAALVKAEATITDPKRDGNNPHFKSKYITLDAVIEATRAPLAKAGVRVVQSPSTDERGVSVTTRLIHADSGEWLEDTLTMPISGNATAQAVGSAITYARRYALLAMLNLGGEDDDGQAASAAAPAHRQSNGAFPGTVHDTITTVTAQERKNKAGKAFTLFTIVTGKNGELNTFDEKVGGAAKSVEGTGEVVSITGEANGNYAPKCTSVAPVKTDGAPKDPADDLPF